jgi:hypothetical protein
MGNPFLGLLAQRGYAGLYFQSFHKPERGQFRLPGQTADEVHDLIPNPRESSAAVEDD